MAAQECTCKADFRAPKARPTPFLPQIHQEMRVRADANKRIGALWYSAHGPSHCNFNCNNCVGKSRGSFVELGQQSDITHPVVRLDFFLELVLKIFVEHKICNWTEIFLSFKYRGRRVGWIELENSGSSGWLIGGLSFFLHYFQVEFQFWWMHRPWVPCLVGMCL